MTNQKQKKKKKNYVPSRLNLLFFAVFLLFSALILRLGFVQIVFGEDFRKEVDRTENVTVNTLVPRGKIYDRNQKVVVDNTPLNAITYTRMQSTTPKEQLEVAKKLAEIITMDTNKIQERDEKDYWILTRPEEAAELITDKDRKKVADGEIEESELYDLQLKRITKEQLAEITEEEKEVLAIFREFNKGYALTPQIVKNQDVTAKEFAMVSEMLADLPGVDITTDFIRSYAYGSTLDSVFGKVSTSESGIPSEKVDEFLARGYSRNDRIGTSQLESQYENVLQGQKARVRNVTDTGGNLLHQEKVYDGQRGKDLILSIDMEFQQKVEEVLIEEMLQTRATPSAKARFLDRAFVVVMNPKTGEVLSLAGKQLIRDEEDGQLKVYDNALGAIQEAYEPGSTVKGASVLAGFQHGVIQPGSYLYDAPVYIGRGNEALKKASYTNMGSINDLTALERSSNVYMFRIAMAIAGANYQPRQPLFIPPAAYDTFRSYLAQFGLGVETGIDLPRESSGVEGTDTSIPGLLLDLSIGQYDTYTTLQLAQYVSTIANGGYRMKPQLVREIREPNNDGEGLGRLVEPFQPQVLNRVDMSDNHIKRVQDGFIRVYHGARGTASSSKMKQYKPAGKSGTAESRYIEYLPNGERRSYETLNFNLVGYAPYDDPEIAFAIMVPYASTDFNVTGGISTRIGDAVMDAYFTLKKERAKEKPEEEQTDEAEEESNNEDTEQ
ncbi:penicillin-binding protein [Sutcliffiella horikoshii]|uniref:serine-type D-Ala-D-Ala carboxypeptidase n=1 Tax=Sutcliffiella horikoshii TaxID=79883 RepID=A0A1Y0CPW3_9BACI|nr:MULTISPECIES: penicillin-binding protein 2 [Bacillaceae]ART77289.1 penicillin-binding protein [Sutcliffiella horikoshii]TYS74174.1 penicillin-binding protein 2 [Sutcliffiella horikoshii]